MSRFVCVEAGVCKMLKAKQKRVKLVDASGMAVKMHAEKAVGAEEEQEWHVRMESVGRKSGNLENLLLAEADRKPWRKRAKMPHPRGEPEEEDEPDDDRLTVMMMVMVMVVRMITETMM